MPSPDLLDFAALTAPIPGDDPAGSASDFYNVRRFLDEARTSHDPSQFPASTEGREQPAREANWPKIVQETKSHLATKCKHLVYAARMAEALVMQHGLAGVRDGMKLLRMMFSDCWDRMYPKIEEPGDEAARVAQVNWLGDPLSGAMFPTKIRTTPLFGALSWQNWKDASGDFEAAVAATPTERVQTLIDDASAAIQEIRDLTAIAAERVPDESAELGELSRAVGDCLNLARQAMAKKGGGAPAEGDIIGVGETGAVSSGAGGTIAVMDPTAQRTAIYEQINRLAEQLQKIDSHSPVPWLLRKLTKLGPMPFHELVALLTRNDSVLEFMKPDEDKPQD